ncbi:MAG: hypothetical protein JWO63_3323 [Frankiales bacterium]|jgi:hypothetical protein|nr:hypothetical protein [Frankiales bacterium]
MTERKPPKVSWASWIEQQIRGAQNRGSFDDLPGAGKPIPGLKEPHDDMAWIAAKLRRENLSIAAILPPSLALAKEVEDLPERLAQEKSEAGVRRVVEDLNDRILKAHRRPQEGPPLRVMAQDVDRRIAEWRAARAT